MMSAVFKPTVMATTTMGTTTETTAIAYDDNGNTTTSGSDVYSWNYRNQMTKATKGTAISTYAYDENGNRVRLTEGKVTTFFPNRYYNRIGTTGTTTKHIFAGDLLIATIEKGVATSTIHYLHADHLGGTNVITNAIGATEEVIDYLPYGTIRVDEKTANYTGEKRKYAGTENDGMSGLNYMMARYQNAEQGRFLSQDPVFWEIKQNLQNPQSLNSYNYANNNPINLKDPNGRNPFIIAGAAAYVGAVTFDRGVDIYQNYRDIQAGKLSSYEILNARGSDAGIRYFRDANTASIMAMGSVYAESSALAFGVAKAGAQVLGATASGVGSVATSFVNGTARNQNTGQINTTSLASDFIGGFMGTRIGQQIPNLAGRPPTTITSSFGGSMASIEQLRAQLSQLTQVLTSLLASLSAQKK